VIGPLPLVILNYTSPLLMAQLERLLTQHNFDVIQIEGIFLTAYVQRIRQLAPRALLNADWHNVESGLMERYANNEKRFAHRLYAKRTASLVRKVEDQFIRTCDSHTVCSDLERQHLLSRHPGATVEVIPNGVDVQAFPLTPEADPERRSIIFVGAMDYHANVDAARFFANEVWPAIYDRHPDLQFVVVGSKPVPEVRQLAERPGITVTGTVDDLRPYYQSALAAVVPLRIGGGTRLKILEALAAGTPVISTAIGAEGLPLLNGKNILIADSPTEMLEAVALLKQDSELRNNLVAAGRDFVAPYDWSAIGEKLLRFYDAQLTVHTHSAAQ
jgi:glycosyltransferase involved in cell wall biosynthesis